MSRYEPVNSGIEQQCVRRTDEPYTEAGAVDDPSSGSSLDWSGESAITSGFTFRPRFFNPSLFSFPITVEPVHVFQGFQKNLRRQNIFARSSELRQSKLFNALQNDSNVDTCGHPPGYPLDIPKVTGKITEP